ncbi:MAG: serine/threonine-protein kinase [Candidatus Micrarchaeota archaeon]
MGNSQKKAIPPKEPKAETNQSHIRRSQPGQGAFPADKTIIDRITQSGQRKAKTTDSQRKKVEKLIGEVFPVTDASWYKITGVLGSGAMGTVLDAIHVIINDVGDSSSRPVAIKVIQFEDEEMEKKFMQEMAALFQIQHHNIVSVNHFGRKDAWLYYVMEFLDGETLANEVLMRHGGIMTWGEAQDIAVQLCDGIGYAHDTKIIHRDIKPDNIFILHPAKGKRTVKLIDFGLVLNLDEEQVLDRIMRGTPSYMSPEQCKGDALDHRSDIYSVGVVLYEMLTGNTPHNADNVVQLAGKIIVETPEPAISINPHIPQEVSDAIDKCLAKTPEDRFQTIWELRDILEGAKPNPEEARLDPNSTMRTKAVRQKRRPVKLFAAMGAAVVICGAALGAGLMMREQNVAQVPEIPARIGQPSNPSPAPAKLLQNDIMPPEPIRADAAAGHAPPEKLMHEIIISTNVSGAQVSVNGEDKGRTSAKGAITLMLEHGEDALAVTVQKTGYRTLHMDIVPDGDRTATAKLREQSSKRAPSKSGDSGPSKRKQSIFSFDPTKR